MNLKSSDLGTHSLKSLSEECAWDFYILNKMCWRLQESSSARLRDKRDAEDYEEESNNVWDDDRAPMRRSRKQRNTCRRKPLYVDFAEIHYDTWIVAPDGYEVLLYIRARGLLEKYPALLLREPAGFQ